MSRPTRVEAQQWGWGRSVPDPWQLADQIQSLRARIEALELARRIQSGTLTPAEQAELGVVPVADLEAAVHRAAAEARDSATAELPAASAEARPAKGLVLRVSETNNSRDAIRAVAAWLREGGDYSADAWADMLEREVFRG